ncbi:MAG: hypothetical protein ACLR60_11915 [Clostridium paraputrificum]
MAGDKIDTKIKKKEKHLKQIFELKGVNFKEWYLEKLSQEVENNLDSLFELIDK